MYQRGISTLIEYKGFGCYGPLAFKINTMVLPCILIYFEINVQVFINMYFNLWLAISGPFISTTKLRTNSSGRQLLNFLRNK